MSRLVFLISLFIISQLSAQTPDSLVKYTTDYRFADGLYVNFEQFRTNSPIASSQIITDLNYEDTDFFDKLLESDQVSFFDHLGTTVSVEVKKLWGYCDNGRIYIRYNRDFNLLPYIGALSHFVANKDVYYTNYGSGYPYYYNPYTGSYTYGYTPNSRSVEMQQYILDCDQTGQVLEFNPENLLVLLMRVPELYDEYNALKKKKQRQLMFFYLRKFNEKRPLLLPDN